MRYAPKLTERHPTRRQLLHCMAACYALSLISPACRSNPTRRLRGETVRAACAMCLFEMEGIRGCMWAVEVDHELYLAEGNLPKHHDPHGPDGMCNIERQAVVTGEIVNNRLIARHFDLRPAPHVPDRRAPPHQH